MASLQLLHFVFPEKLVLCNLPQKSIATKIVPRLPKKKMRDANDYTVGLVYIVGK